jgi:hypothetical protein
VEGAFFERESVNGFVNEKEINQHLKARHSTTIKGREEMLNTSIQTVTGQTLT